MDPLAKLYISIIVLLGIFNFVISAGESAFFSMKNLRNIPLSKEICNRYFSILYDSERLLSTFTLGSTVFNSCMIVIYIITFEELNIAYFMFFLCIIMIYMSLIGEIIPKTLALKAPAKWSLRLAKPIYLFHQISKPLCFLAQKICDISTDLLAPKTLENHQITTEEEFSELIDWAYNQGVLEKSEREMMDEIIKLDRRTAEEVMKPRSEMICIEDNVHIEQMIILAKYHKYTRLPIFHDKPDNIVGILNTRKLLLQPEQDLSESIEFPSFVPAKINLMDLLKSLQSQRRGLAIVLDEFGGTAGLITIEDILEELVGEMREEGEKAEFTIEKLNRDRWRVNGSLPIDEFKKLVPQFKGLSEVDTMGGLITALIEVVPRNGDMAKINGFELTVVNGDERRVKELIVKKSV